MIRKSVKRFSEKIMLKQKAKRTRAEHATRMRRCVDNSKCAFAGFRVRPHSVMYGRPPLGKGFFGAWANESGSGHVYVLEMRPLTAGPDGDRGSNSNHCGAL